MFEEFKSNDFFSYVYCKKHRIYGIDISKIVSLRVNRHKNLHSIVADINKTPFKKNSFDLIISLSTLDHLKVKDFYNVIKQFELILKPKGQVFLTLDNKHNKLYFLEFFFWKYLFSIYDRDKCYEISDVKRILKGSKLKIVGIDAVMHFPAFIDKILIFINLFFPETKIFTDKLSELIVKITNKYVNTAEKRILFGRFLSFKIEKI
jgi:SAM-dependent methyltransferase